ncbi:MAG: zinc ribbon domain-containing protein [Planctomycetota bacterium]
MTTHCPSCGYDLGGIDADETTRCPECGELAVRLLQTPEFKAVGRHKRCLVGLAILAIYPLFSLLLASMLVVAKSGHAGGAGLSASVRSDLAGDFVVLALVTLGVVLPAGIPFAIAAWRSRPKARAALAETARTGDAPEGRARAEPVAWTLLAITFALGMGPYLGFMGAAMLR